MKIRRFTGKIYWNADKMSTIPRAFFDPTNNSFRLEYDATEDFPPDQANLTSADGFNFSGKAVNDLSSRIKLRFYDTNGKAALVGIWNDFENHLCVIELEEVDEFKD